jgi:hypothetical protein
MTNNTGISTKISREGMNFLLDLEANVRLNMKIKNLNRKKIPLSKSLEIVAKYFKANNDKYLELIKLCEKEI